MTGNRGEVGDLRVRENEATRKARFGPVVVHRAWWVLGFSLVAGWWPGVSARRSSVVGGDLLGRCLLLDRSLGERVVTVVNVESPGRVLVQALEALPDDVDSTVRDWAEE